LLSAAEVQPAVDPDDARVGQLLANRYQVRRIVADGGMGRVYEALDLQAERRVALKILHPAVVRDRVAVERFKREYEISKLLPHEHIVEVFDYFALDDGTYALAMDFLEGEELRSLLKREKTVRPARLIRMLSQIAIGLDEAHQRQIIHRDIKPDNVFVCGTREGDIIKLLDFGSVKDKSEGAKKLTVMGTTIGSPYYMSPEQAQGLDTLDARADVWALAAISYEVLTQQVPFPGKNGTAILLAILTQEPIPASRAARDFKEAYPIPPTVDAVLKEAFAKDPIMRVASVGLLADKLGHAFGLEGMHRDWAYADELDLHARIESVLPELMRAAPEPEPLPTTPVATVEADPFALTTSDAKPSPAGEKAGSSTEELRAVVVPKRLPIALIVGLFVGGLMVLLVGAVLVILWLR
jgi:serine/threonine-protein kinase